MPSLGQLISGLFAPRDLPLRAYGKVPFAAEYRRLNTGGPAASAFCRWLDDGRAAWMQHSDQSAVAPTRLFVRPIPRGDFVAAHIRGSHDSLGRPFPLAFFVTIPRAALGDDPLAAWLIARRLDEQLAVLFDELAAVERADGFQAAFGSRRLVLGAVAAADAAAQRDAALQLAAGDWFAAAGRDPGVDVVSLAPRARRWRGNPQTLRQLAVECPLLDGLDRAAQAAVWTAWFGGLARAAGCELQWVWPADEPAALWLLGRDLLPSDFQLLTPQARGYGFVEPLLGRIGGVVGGVAGGGVAGAVGSGAPQGRAEPGWPQPGTAAREGETLLSWLERAGAA